MKNIFLITPFLLALSFTSIAQDEVQVENASLNKSKVGHRKAGKGVRKLVIEHMLENGHLTTHELEERRAERHTVRAELKQLKQSGDEAAFQTKLTELRAIKSERREEVKAYIAEHADLAQEIEILRSEMRAARFSKREN